MRVFYLPSFSPLNSTAVLILHGRSYLCVAQFDIAEISDVQSLAAGAHLPMRIQNLPVFSTCCQLAVYQYHYEDHW